MLYLTLLLWALAVIASVLGMGLEEDSRPQDIAFGIACIAGGIGFITLIGSL